MSDAPKDPTDWKTLQGLTNHLQTLLADMDKGFVFAPAPKPGDNWGPPEGTLVLRNQWTMELQSTATLVASVLRLEVPPPDRTQGYWGGYVTPENIKDTSIVVFCRELHHTASNILTAVGRT